MPVRSRRDLTIRALQLAGDNDVPDSAAWDFARYEAALERKVAVQEPELDAGEQVAKILAERPDKSYRRQKQVLGHLDCSMMTPEARAYREKNQQIWYERMAAAERRRDEKDLRSLLRKQQKAAIFAKKQGVHIFMDREVVAFFKRDGYGWTTRINDMLLDYVRTRNS